MTEDRRKEESQGPALVSYDGGKTWTEAHIQRGKPWRWEIVVVAGLSLLIGGIGWQNTGNVADNNKVGLEAICVPLREAQITALQERIDQSRSIDYETVFPGVPPDQLHTLIHEANVRYRVQRDAVAAIDCQSPFEKPTQTEEDGPDAG